MTDNLTLKVVEGLLNWPFLAFVLIAVSGLVFRKEFAERISSIRELTFGGKTKILLGTHEIEAREIGSALTSAFRELEARVEKVEAAASGGIDQLSLTDSADSTLENVPDGLKTMLWASVYRMLNSEYWYARYVDTLANNTSTSHQLMLEFLRSRPEVDVFKDGDRWAASLKSRSRSRS